MSQKWQVTKPNHKRNDKTVCWKIAITTSTTKINLINYSSPVQCMMGTQCRIRKVD